MPITGPDNITRFTYADNANYVIEQLRALGFKPNPTSRLMKMARLLNRGVTIESDDPEFPIARESLRDLQILAFVFSQVNAHRGSNHFKDLIYRLMQDSALPQNDTIKSAGRDTQFELYLAAICQNAGLLPVDYKEPDVICNINNQTYGIAAKRIKNRNSFEKNVRKGIYQLNAQSLPGFIAVDVSIALNPKNVYFTNWPNHGFLLSHQRLALRSFIDKRTKEINRWAKGTKALGLILYDWRIILMDNKNWDLNGMSLWYSMVNKNTELSSMYNEFYEAYMAGVPGRADLD